MTDSSSASEQPHSADRKSRSSSTFALGVLIGGVTGALLMTVYAAMIRGEQAPRALPTTGRIEGPAGLRFETLRVRASRGGRGLGEARVDERGAFELNVPREGPFDLHVTDWRAWRDPHAIRPAERVADVESPTEGGIRELAWGARAVRVRVDRVPRADVTIRVLDFGGAPLPGATVSLKSSTDEVWEKTGDDGAARFERIPVRSWRADASWGRGERSLVRTSIEVIPSGQAVEVRIPTATRVSVRFAVRVAGDVVLDCTVPRPETTYVRIPWRPGADGSMSIWTAPDCPSLSVTATEIERLDERSRRERGFAAGAIAVSEGVELVLEPLPR